MFIKKNQEMGKSDVSRKRIAHLILLFQEAYELLNVLITHY
jgi:hypothetical protein